MDPVWSHPGWALPADSVCKQQPGNCGLNFKSSGWPLWASVCPKAPAYLLSFPHWLFIHMDEPRPLSLELPGTTTKLHVRSLKPIDPPNNIFSELYPSDCVPLRATALLTVKHSPCFSYCFVLCLEVVSILPEFLIFWTYVGCLLWKEEKQSKTMQELLHYMFLFVWFSCVALGHLQCFATFSSTWLQHIFIAPNRKT